MKGQLSAEMLIMIVVILAIVGIAATQLVGTAKESGESIENQTANLNRMTSEALKGDEGDRCITDDECLEGLYCPSYRCVPK
ncbi:MAG: hypothetical protein V1861_02780 [Candidatus Micrarchaeota archaeon]